MALIVLAIIVVLLLPANRAASVAPVSATSGRIARPTTSMDDEPTQMKILGHRLVRVAGGVSVGDPYPLFDRATIGRNQGCTVPLSDPLISSIHAEVKIDLDKAFIADKGSTNGTLLNDEKLPSEELRPLKDGDTIRVGAITLMYRSQP